MDIADRLVIAVLTQGLLDHGVKRLLLIPGGQGRAAAEKSLHEALPQLLRVLGVIEHAVEIRAPILEGRKEETCQRKLHQPVPHPGAEAVVLRVVA